MLLNKKMSMLFMVACLAGSPVVFAATDAEIVTAVAMRIKSSVPSSAATITITTVNGIVFLSGTAASLNDASAAIQTANSISGVKDVNTQQLLVQGTGQSDQDAYITARVQGLFVRENLYANKPARSSDIKVETKSGIVYLTGRPDTTEQQNNAIKLIRQMDGVKDVVSTIDTNH